MGRHHGKGGNEHRPRKGMDNPSFQHDESQHGIERITSPKRNRKIRSSISSFQSFFLLLQ